MYIHQAVSVIDSQQEPISGPLLLFLDILSATSAVSAIDSQRPI